MRLGIVSPASPTDRQSLEAGLAAIHARGLETKLMPHALDVAGPFAGTDVDRAADLEAAFKDPDVDAVLCARGGYGCARLLPLLDLELIAAHAKPFLGYSDVTMLHLALGPRDVPTFHAPMVISFTHPKPEWMFASFAGALAGDFRVPAEAPRGTPLRGGWARGTVAGGNLTMLADSLGTPFAFDGRGKLVLIEDVHERPHRIDAMLTHLLNSGALDEAAGFVIGEMTDTDTLREGQDLEWREIVRERLSPLGRPIVVGYPFGHIDAELTLPLGREAILDADEGTLNYSR